MLIDPGHAAGDAVEAADNAGEASQPLQEGEFVIIKDDP
jgi:hypothetical protein